MRYGDFKIKALATTPTVFRRRFYNTTPNVSFRAARISTDFYAMVYLSIWHNVAMCPA